MFGLDLNLKNEPSISTDFENLTTLFKHRSKLPPPPPPPLRLEITYSPLRVTGACTH